MYRPASTGRAFGEIYYRDVYIYSFSAVDSKLDWSICRRVNLSFGSGHGIGYCMNYIGMDCKFVY